MKQRVHIHIIEVSGKGQIIHFQVRIPRDAKRIIGILISENAAVDGVPPKAEPVPKTPAIADVRRSRILYPVTVGTVLLQTRGHAYFLYAEDIIHDDNSFLTGDFSKIHTARAEGGGRELSGGAKKQALCVEIEPQNTKLFGIYRDEINQRNGKDSSYLIKLYFYYEQK